MKESPFLNLVRYPGIPLSRTQFLAYNSIFQVVNSFADSALPIQEDADLIAKTVAKAFTAVKNVWPEAWGKRPAESKLMHGAGLRAMAALLAEILVGLLRQYDGLDKAEVWTTLTSSLQRLRTVVLWDDTAVTEGNRNQQRNYKKEIMTVQNTNQDIAELTKFLQKESLALDTSAKKAS
jgi:hypothetical protein